jgi:hypothetical protein
VFSGLIPVDIRLINLMAIQDLCQYFTTWGSSLQSSSRYSVEKSMSGCHDGCRARLWPGGVETIRQQSSRLNTSIFHGEHFAGVEAINIKHAPGIATQFRDLSPDFTFDLNEDCIYGTQVANDSVKICIQQMGQDLAVGKLNSNFTAAYCAIHPFQSC